MDPDLLDFEEQLNLLDEIEAEEKEECRLRIIIPDEELPPNPKLPSSIKEISIATKNISSMPLIQITQPPLAKRRKTFLSNHEQDSTPISVVREPLLHNRIPIASDYVSLTLMDGQRRYLTIEEPSIDDVTLDVNIRRPLLLDELSTLIDNAEQLIKLKKLSTVTTPTSKSLSNGDEQASQLWVKKYEPARYLDLISSESINRQLLCWLHAWNCYVFGTEPKVKPIVEPAPPLSTEEQKPKKSWNNNKDNSGVKFTKFERPNEEVTISQLDARDGRPVYRLVLLSGPPGLGKTTMAHILARHAGYQVVETNSSDDRSPKAIRDRLEAVASYQSNLNITGGDDEARLKPSCLILDEIDGALATSVELLAEAACNTHGGLGGGKKKRGKLFLRRPVICICNDLYAPSLRSLRMPGVPCYVMRLPNIDLNRLVTRLDWIADKEEIDIDKHFLSSLAESSGRDIRACLNVLQFVKATQTREPGKNLSVTSLLSVLEASGKDAQHNLFSAWQAVFNIPQAQVLTRHINRLTGRPKNTSATVTSSDSTLQARVAHTLEICNSAGEPPSLILGLFENYLGRRMKDASLQTAQKASEWLLYSDHLFNYTQTMQDYSLMRYIRFLPAWFHLSFASTVDAFVSRWKPGGGGQDRPGALKWPTSYSDNIGAARRTQAIVESLLENQWRAASGGKQPIDVGMQENVVHNSLLTSLRCLTRRQFLLDAASYLNILITAVSTSLRPVNSQLYNNQEKQRLSHLIGLMITLGLDWVPQHSVETEESTYSLEPPLDTLAVFTSSWKAEKELPYATKQMLARELTLERMRRAEAVYTGISTVVIMATASPTVIEGSKSSRLVSDTFIMERLAPKAAPLSSTLNQDKSKKDFFGRPVVEKHVVPAENENISPTFRCPINETMWFKFKEGHSNAVRRPFLMSQFI